MGEKGAKLDPASEAFQQEVVSKLTPIGGVTSRKMFGGFGVFHEGAMFAIVSKQKLYFKVGPETLPDYVDAGSLQHKPMPYYSVPDDVYGNTASLKRWAKKAAQVAHDAPAKTARKK